MLKESKKSNHSSKKVKEPKVYLQIKSSKTEKEVNIILTNIINGRYFNATLTLDSVEFGKYAQLIVTFLEQYPENKYALFWLGRIYYCSLGEINKDLDKCLRYYTKSARLDYDLAMIQLAILYLNYDGSTDVKYNTTIGIKYLEDCKSHSIEATDMLANIYRHGLKGVERDLERTLLYYELNAKRKDIGALKQLGIMYMEGESGLEKDEKKAFAYFELAYNLCCGEVIVYLARLYELGLGVEKNLRLAVLMYYRFNKFLIKCPQYNVPDWYVQFPEKIKKLCQSEPIDMSTIIIELLNYYPMPYFLT